MKNYLTKNSNFAESEVKMPFSLIQIFMKSEGFGGFFPNLIPSVLEH